MSLDLDVPPAHRHWNGAPDRKCAIVPLTYLAKRRHPEDQHLPRDFDVRDESGASIPILTHYENALAAWSTLVFAAETAHRAQTDAGSMEPDADRQDVRLTSDEAELLWQIVTLPAEDAKEQLSQVLEARDGQLPHLEKALGEIAFLYLLKRFSEDYLVLAHLPSDQAAQRRVLKYSYDVGQATPRLRDVRAWLRWWAGRLGLASVPFLFRLRSFVPVGSLHFEFVAPEGVVITGAQLRAENKLANGVTRARAVQDNRISRHRTTSHLHLAGPVPLNAEYLARVYLHARPDIAAWVAFISACLLAAFLWYGGTDTMNVLNGQDAAMSILLIVPGLIAGAVALRREHQLAEQLLLGVRIGAVAMVLLAAWAVATFVASAPPLLGPNASQMAVRSRLELWAAEMRPDWHFLAALSAFVILLLLSNITPKRQRLMQAVKKPKVASPDDN